MREDLVPLKHISDISAYVAGKNSSDKKKVKIKLSSNESPWGAAPGVKKVIRDNLKVLNRYPLCQPYNLRSKIARRHGLSPDNVILGNGSNEIIQFLISSFAGTKKTVLIPEISFSMYRIYSEIAGSPVKTIPMNGLEIDLGAIQKKINSKTGVVFLTSPNNPTGSILNRDDLIEFIDTVPKSVVIVIDEAYAEFCDKSLRLNAKSILSGKQHKNILIMRTFSKLFGLSALRIGYGLGSVYLIETLNKVRQHFNTNHLANIAAEQALSERTFYDNVKSRVIKGRTYLENKFSELGFPYIKSYANFVTLQVRNGIEAEKNLYKDGFIVRELSSFNMTNYLRITVDKDNVNRMLINSLKKNINILKP